MKWLTKSKLGKAVLVLGVLLVVVGILAAIVHVNSKSAVEKYRDKLRAAGEKLTVVELIPLPVPPEQNGATLFLRAGNSFKLLGGVLQTNRPSAMEFVASGKAKVGWQQPYVQNQGGSNSWEEIESALMEPFGTLDLPSAEHPVLDFGLDYGRGFNLPIRHLSPLRGYSLFLSAATVCNLHRGNAALAVTNIRTILAITEGMQAEPLMFSESVRASIALTAASVTWELLQSPDLTEPQLALLQRDWAGLEFLCSTEKALQMERAMNVMELANLRTSNSPVSVMLSMYTPGGSPGPSVSSGDWLEDLRNWSKDTWSGTQHRTVETFWRVSWSYADELRTLEGTQVLIDAIRQVQTNGFFKNAFIEKEKRLTASGFHGKDDWEWLWKDFDGSEIRYLGAGSTLFLDNRLADIERIEAVRQLVVTAIALKQFQLRHGALPSALNALAPESLPTIPRDPVDGLPLRYRLNADGTFLLYSIGEDGKDDGGDATSHSGKTTTSWERQRDIVWPQPVAEGN